MNLFTFNFQSRRFSRDPDPQLNVEALGLTTDGGFVALISAVIIALVLLIFVVGTGAGGFYTRFDVFGSEIKEVSYGLAESCVHTAILKVSQDSSYSPGAGGEVVPVGDEECTILSYNSGTGEIEVSAVYQDSVTNLLVDIDMANFSINSWEEVPTH